MQTSSEARARLLFGQRDSGDPCLPTPVPGSRAQAARRRGSLARTPHCGEESRQESAPTCCREGLRELGQSENLLEAGSRFVFLGASVALSWAELG